MSRFKRTALLIILLAGGLYCAGKALWNMGKTAMFVHESAVITAKVVDMEKRPFESWTEAMQHGNLPWDGETAYRPIVSCTLPKEPEPIPQPRLKVNDLDNQDYATGQDVEIILPLTMPEQVHLKRWKFLWGGDCLLLLFGLLLGAAGYLPLRRRKRRSPAAKSKAAPKPKEKPQTPPAAQPKPTPQPAPAPEPRRKPAAPRRAPAPPQPEPGEEPFRLESTPPPKKKRTRKPKDPNAPAKPRTLRKKKTDA